LHRLDRTDEVEHHVAHPLVIYGRVVALLIGQRHEVALQLRAGDGHEHIIRLDGLVLHLPHDAPSCLIEFPAGRGDVSEINSWVARAPERLLSEYSGYAKNQRM